MSRSVHTSRPKFRKAFRFSYSTDGERTRVLGKIINEIGLKRTMKWNARLKRQSEKAGLKPSRVYIERHAAASKRALPSVKAKRVVQRWNQRGYS